MVLVDLWSRLKQWLHEQVQKGRHSDLKARKISRSIAPLTSMQWNRLKAVGSHQLHRRWVHTAEHLEQDCDVCRIQGPFGQHGTQGLAGSRVGCCCTERQGYLTGIMTSEIQTTTTELLSSVKSKQQPNQCTSFCWNFSITWQSPSIIKNWCFCFKKSRQCPAARFKYWVTVFDGIIQVTNVPDISVYTAKSSTTLHYFILRTRKQSTSECNSLTKRKKVPLMCRFLHLLADPTNSWTALFLQSEDGHHCLGKQVGVLAMTHHLL